MRNYQKRLFRSCEELGLKIQLDYPIKLNDGLDVTVPVLLPQLGANRGMIVVSSFDEALAIEKKLELHGLKNEYGFSCLSDFSDKFDRSISIEMFSDWGWSDPDEIKPPWMIDPPDEDS